MYNCISTHAAGDYKYHYSELHYIKVFDLGYNQATVLCLVSYLIMEKAARLGLRLLALFCYSTRLVLGK